MINFFSYKLEQKDQSQIGVSQVLATIQQGTSEWPQDRLRVSRKFVSPRTRKFHTFFVMISLKYISVLFVEIPRTEVQICRRRTTGGVFHSLRVGRRPSGSVIALERGKHKIVFFQ